MWVQRVSEARPQAQSRKWCHHWCYDNNGGRLGLSPLPSPTEVGVRLAGAEAEAADATWW